MPASEPVPNSEVNVLESLIMIRNKLTVLKRHGGNYQSDELQELYDKLNSSVSELLSIRKIQNHDGAEYHNRVDDVIDDVYQLLSLFWMALGKNLESPATYVQLISIEQCLEHLHEFEIYTLDDIQPFEKRIEELSIIIDEEKEKNKNSNEEGHFVLNSLAQKKLCHCQNMLKSLKENWEAMSDTLAPIQSRLVEIRKLLAIQVARGQLDIEATKKFQKELREIDAMKSEGKFSTAEGKALPGQAQVVGLLEECFNEVDSILSSQIEIAENLKPIFEQLMQIKDQLSKLYITRRWTMREPDLWAFQVQLSEIDSLYKKGKFNDADGKPLKGQTMLHFLLQKCYRIIYKLLASSVPVAEALAAIHNQLYTLRKCLIEVKTWGGPFSVRELYPYQIKLASIDNLRVDGKFLDEHGQEPEGQALVLALLNECQGIICELKNLVEE